MVHYGVVQHVLAWIGRDASDAVQTSAHAVAVLCSVCKFDGFAVCFKNVLEFGYGTENYIRMKIGRVYICDILSRS